MAAAYAALNSVMYILQQIQHHPRPPITIENQQMESLCEIISFLQDFLEKHPHRDIGDGNQEALKSQIADAAYAAEDIIESHIVDQILVKSNFHEENNCIDLFCRGVKKMIRNLSCSTSHKTDQILTGDRERSSNTIFCQDLQKVIQDMNFIKKEVIKIQEKMKGIDDDQLPINIISMSACIVGSSIVPPPTRKNTNTMVGFDDVLEQIVGRLIGHSTKRQVLPIVGMGGIVFPEDRVIPVSQLRKLWAAEGFLKPVAAKSLEEVAEEYLKDLIGRNLILVHKLGSSGKVKYCKIHDLLRDLCLREGERDKFLWVRTENNLEGIQSQRRISIHEGSSKENYHIDRVLEALPSASFARSLNCDFKGVRLSFHRFRLVRVFNVEDKYSYYNEYSLKDVFKLMNSWYLHFRTGWKSTPVFPSSIHLLWNLQTLIIQSYDRIHVPPEIWEMSQLRHLETDSWFFFRDPPNVPLIHEGDEFILRNLHTIKRVRNFKLSEEVIKRIPNIKKLGVSYDGEGCQHNYCLNNLGLLNKLESLNIDCLVIPKRSCQIEFVQNFPFPNSLKKLTLHDTYLHWEDMRMIGSLPHLQVLKLGMNSFPGPEWNPVEGEFLCLKFLLIKECYNLVHWNANRTHFPCLEKLVLISMRSLKEIPLDIGEILTLQSIELWHCNDSVIMSAKNLLDEQVDLGNEDLQVFIWCRKNIELERLRTHNFQVSSV